MITQTGIYYIVKTSNRYRFCTEDFMSEKYEFRKFEDKYVLRLNKGAEIVDTLKEFCAEHKILLGKIEGIGAINSATFGFFSPITKEYQERTFEEPMEVLSLLGNISTKEGSTYLHLHLSASGEDYKVVGGHLIKAIISMTGEIVITPIKGTVERQLDENIGLNLMKF